MQLAGCRPCSVMLQSKCCASYCLLFCLPVLCCHWWLRCLLPLPPENSIFQRVAAERERITAWKSNRLRRAPSRSHRLVLTKSAALTPLFSLWQSLKEPLEQGLSGPVSINDGRTLRSSRRPTLSFASPSAVPDRSAALQSTSGSEPHEVSCRHFLTCNCAIYAQIAWLAIKRRVLEAPCRISLCCSRVP